MMRFRLLIKVVKDTSLEVFPVFSRLTVLLFMVDLVPNFLPEISGFLQVE